MTTRSTTRWLIYEGEIAGKLMSESEPPPGYQVVEGVDATEGDVYYEDGKVILKPPQPSSSHFWNGREWISAEPQIQPQIQVIPLRDFEGLERALRSSEIFGRAAQAAAQDTAANFYLTMILYGLSSGRNSPSPVNQPSASANDIAFGFKSIRSIMSELGLDFSPEQLEFIKNALAENNFDPAEFGLDSGDEQ